MKKFNFTITIPAPVSNNWIYEHDEYTLHVHGEFAAPESDTRITPGHPLDIFIKFVRYDFAIMEIGTLEKEWQDAIMQKSTEFINELD